MNASIILKLLVVVCVLLGQILSLKRNGAQSLLYFTNQSNFWIGIVCLIGAIRMISGRPVTRFTHLCKLTFTVAIMLTGFVYCFILLPVEKLKIHPESILTHVCVPLLAIADFFVYRSTNPYQVSDLLWALIPEAYYMIFAGIGYVRKWNFSSSGYQNYPYFFLNWGSPLKAFGFSSKAPYLGTVWWILVVLGIVLSFTRILIGRGR